MATSSKEKKEEILSLEDQNAAAVQSIIDAKIALEKTAEIDSLQSQPVNYPTPSDSANSKISKKMDFDKISQPRLDDSVNKQIENQQDSLAVQHEVTSVVTASVDKDVCESENIENSISNIDVTEGDVIIFDPSESFVESVNKAMIDSSVITKNQTVLPSNSGTSQVMTITIPSTAGTLQESSFIGNTQPSLQPHGLVTSNSNSLVTISIPGTLNSVPQVPAQQVPKQQDLMSVSTVIMCGNDGVVPQFINIPQQESGKYNCLLTLYDSIVILKVSDLQSCDLRHGALDLYCGMYC